MESRNIHCLGQAPWRAGRAWSGILGCWIGSEEREEKLNSGESSAKGCQKEVGSQRAGARDRDFKEVHLLIFYTTLLCPW